MYEPINLKLKLFLWARNGVVDFLSIRNKQSDQVRPKIHRIRPCCFHHKWLPCAIIIWCISNFVKPAKLFWLCLKPNPEKECGFNSLDKAHFLLEYRLWINCKQFVYESRVSSKILRWYFCWPFLYLWSLILCIVDVLRWWDCFCRILSNKYVFLLCFKKKQGTSKHDNLVFKSNRQMCDFLQHS